MDTSNIRKGLPASALLDRKIVAPAIRASFVKLDPRTLMKNPVMFVLEVVTALTTIILVRDLFIGGAQLLFEVQIVVWLWFTVLFANFRGGRRGTRQGTGRDLAAHAHADAGQAPDRGEQGLPER